MKSNPDIFEPSEVLQKQLNELAGLLGDLIKQVDELRSQVEQILDKMSDLWREVPARCRY
jgi:prefoldin subunit 5